VRDRRQKELHHVVTRITPRLALRKADGQRNFRGRPGRRQCKTGKRRQAVKKKGLVVISKSENQLGLAATQALDQTRGAG